ncbi:MAG: hypothetical protein E6J64_02280 [Deltaproteobacteria bacterium]|nr:MAG: hypothetical protein E6J64_02280 [Deltaproteobacteria bacterium]
MFHVEPTVRGLVLGAFLSAAAVAQTGGRPAAGVAEADAGTAAPAQEPPAKKPPSKKRRTSAPGREKKTRTTAQSGAAGASPKAGASKSTATRDSRTIGIGRSCTKRADCSSAAHVCLRQHDQRGNLFPRGVCALPCAGLEQGLTKARPGFPATDPQTTKKILKVPPPPRCPPRYQCRSKGGDIPIDLCVKG